MNDLFCCFCCGALLQPMGYDKTGFCEKCGSEWKYNDDIEFTRSTVKVEKDDEIYMDR